MAKKSKKRTSPNQASDVNPETEGNKKVPTSKEPQVQDAEITREPHPSEGYEYELLHGVHSFLRGTWEQRVHTVFETAYRPLNKSNTREIYIFHEPEEPARFLGYSEFEHGSVRYDIRVSSKKRGDNPISMAWLLVWTYHLEGDWSESWGAGILHPEEPGQMEGIQFEHLGDDLAISWVKVSDEIPEDLVKEDIFGDGVGDDDPLGQFLATMAPQTLEALLIEKPSWVEKLKDHGIHTIEQLQETSDEELLAIKGFGPHTVGKMREALQQYGFSPSPEYEVDPEQLDKVFRLRVSLERGKKIWRDIEILGHHTLHDLHEMIQVAFDWDDDHLYSFFMSGRFWDGGSAISHPLAGDDMDASETALASLSLKEGQRFAYLFDFGDEWRHIIEVKGIDNPPVPAKKQEEYPKITGSQGKAPEQYPDWDEDE